MKEATRCTICESQVSHPSALYCKRCKRLLDRVDPRKNPIRSARVKALRQAWDGQAFRCYYTGIKLVEDNHKDPRYLTFDHRIPRKESDIVVVAAAINDMKSDLADDEFRAMVQELSNYFNGQGFNESVFNLKYWKR